MEEVLAAALDEIEECGRAAPAHQRLAMPVTEREHPSREGCRVLRADLDVATHSGQEGHGGFSEGAQDVCLDEFEAELPAR